ncbi:hypothetical protein ACXPVS_11325 [Pseudomonas sp. Ma2-10]
MSTSSIRFISGTSSLGVLLLAFSTEGLCALLIDDDLATMDWSCSSSTQLSGCCQSQTTISLVASSC